MSEREDLACPICWTFSRVKPVDDWKYGDFPNEDGSAWRSWACPRCGNFMANQAFEEEVIPVLGTRMRWNLSAWVRQRNDAGDEYTQLSLAFLQGSDEDDLGNAFRSIGIPGFHEKADKLLMALDKTTFFAGQRIPVDEKISVWVARAWASNTEELHAIIRYLRSRDFITTSKHAEGYPTTEWVSIDADGWARLERLKSERQGSDLCFIAMWFSDDLRPLYDQALRPAIWAAGYRPIRIDNEDHANRIPDEIEVKIKASKLIVADLTGDNKGVIYEMGFARGLNIPTILTRKRTELNSEGHFDYKQINTLPWDNLGDLSLFARQLRNRIINLCGRGPAKPPTSELVKLRGRHPGLFEAEGGQEA